MWKKLWSAVAGLGLAAGAADAAEPILSNTGFFDVEQVGSVPPAAPVSRLRSAFQWVRPASAAPSSLAEEGFRGYAFDTPTYPPLAGKGVIPAGAQEPRPTKLPDLPATESVKPTPPNTAASGVPTPIYLADGSMLMPHGATPEGETIYDLVPASQVKRPCATCPPHWRVWASAEALIGMTKHADVPPLVTTGPAFLGPGTAGVLGQPGTVPLFGGGPALNNWRAGLRAELGVWFDRSQNWGLMARYYSLYSTSDEFFGIGTGVNVLNVPQLVPIGGNVVQFPIYAGFPGLTSGAVAATVQTQFAGGDLSLRHQIVQNGHFRIDGLFGYRQLHLGDQLATGFSVSSPFVPGASLLGQDNVRSRNNFYGGQFGGIGTYTWKRLSVEGLGAVALGVNVSDVDFDRGRQLAIGALNPIPLVSRGVSDETTYFGVAAEGGVKLGYRLSDHARLTFGYTGLFWGNVRRAEEQYNLSPVLASKTTSFYAHMLTWGAEFRY